MRLKLLKIEITETTNLVFKIGNNIYAREVLTSDINTKNKLGLYLLEQIEGISKEEEYILEGHFNGQWVLDNFTSETDRDAGRLDIKNLPGWATWTSQEAENWIIQNVNDLNSAKSALRVMAKMLVYLRDSVL